MQTKTWLTLILGLLAVVWSGHASGCGASVTGTGPLTAETRPLVVETSISTTAGVTTGVASSTSEPPAVTSPASVSTQTETEAGQSGVSQLFAELARELVPLPVYGLAELPPGGSIPTEWWPAVSIDSPSSYNGPIRPNPWVSDSPPGAKEAQVLLRLRQGWLMIFENFRGDVGDVQGVDAGEVEGRPASLFELPGGTLVQWSDAGAWYGVFGRGVTVEEVIETAHALHLIDALD